VRVTKGWLLSRVERLDEKLEFLFRHPIKFNPLYLARIDERKLEILTLAMGWYLDIGGLNEGQRRKLFQKCLDTVTLRVRTWEELINLRVALGYPAKRATTLRIAFQKAVQALIEELKDDMLRATTKHRIKADFRIENRG
jgi:hypothetical protein